MNTEEKREMLESSVGFLYKTMLERDPGKRRVKPVKPHLLQLDFTGLYNSSDDSDFEIGNDDHNDDDDEDEEDGDDEDDADDDDACDSDDEFDEDDVDGDGHSDDNDGNDDSGDREKGKSDDSDMEDDEEDMNGDDDYVKADTKILHEFLDDVKDLPSQQKMLKVLICCVCLGDTSEEDNEIVECDSCGASVHEGCYGITEVASVSSSSSSASTEPWFCDACKAGVKPHCELCPNTGGIYKETDASRWVHLVCALYVPGVAFADVDKLKNVTLFEMPYARWGSKECSLCDDARFARTGICIGCDAGMCRTYFHVTCAQREGLLTEASPDEDIADPFFAYCKQHANKQLVNIKRRNWLAVQSCIKNFEHRLGDKEKLRVQRKLTVHQQIFAAEKEQLVPSWVPTVKMPRMLITSAHALCRLLKKAELLGVTQMESVADVRKKWHISPDLSVEFVGYFIDRSKRIDSMKQRVQDLLVQRDKLHTQETSLHKKYEELTKDVEHMKSENHDLEQKGRGIWNIVSSLSLKQLRWTGATQFQNTVKSSPKKMSSLSPTSLIHRCDICKKIHNQHLLVKCDKCHKHQHLSCLDPPLTRMPKKTKLQGWQCSRCVCHSSTDDENSTLLSDEPRQLRKKYLIREPVKYASMFVDPLRLRKNANQHRRCRQASTNSGITNKPNVHKANRKRTEDIKQKTVIAARRATRTGLHRRHLSTMKCSTRQIPVGKSSKKSANETGSYKPVRRRNIQNSNSDVTRVKQDSAGHQQSDKGQMAASDREFFYSSRNDPMRLSITVVSHDPLIEISDDEVS